MKRRKSRYLGKMVVNIFMLSFTVGSALSQDSLRFYPTNWWVGMKHSDLQVMIHYKNVGENNRVSLSYPGSFPEGLPECPSWIGTIPGRASAAIRR